MKIRNFVIAVLLASAAATASFAQLSMSKADWARGPVQYLMTKDEMTAWNAIKSDADADKFIALFWARRDPTPSTPQNEFRNEFEGRMQYADQNFGNGRQRGSLTDRGKVLVLFGAPTRAVRTSPRATQPPAGATSTAVGTEADDSVGETQTWIYEGTTAQKLFNAPKVEIRFVDRMNNKELRMETPRIDFGAATQRAMTAAITQPNLMSVPTYQAAQPVPQPAAAPAAPAAPITDLKTPALEAAVADAKAGKGTSKNAYLSYAEFIAPVKGGYYVPLGFYVPASSGLTADSADTFFGVIEDSTGKRVLAFEEPTKLTPSKSDFFVDKTLDLPAGKYTATVGLAKAGAPVMVTSAPIELAPATGATSRLILSDNVYELTDAAPVKSPFAFGKLKIVPKATMQFTNKDELNYFVEVHNPTLDATTNMPKLQMKLDLVDSKGKTVAGAPLTDAQALPLSGAVGPGEYAIISGIPLSQMAKPLPPGEYTLKMKIVDTISKQSYNLEQKFKITA